MSYTEQHFRSGDKLYASQLNDMDTALSGVANMLSRAEQYYAYLIGAASVYPQNPQTKFEEYLHSLCEKGGETNTGYTIHHDADGYYLNTDATAFSTLKGGDNYERFT